MTPDHTFSGKAAPLFFPLFIDLSEKRITVIGGGKVAARRVRTIRDFSGQVTIVAPKVEPDLLTLAKDGLIILCQRSFQPDDLMGADLVLTAAGAAVDEQVWQLCRERHIPVNVSSDKQKCDFFFPGIARRGSLVAGVTAGGTDHQTARRLTEAIRELLERFQG